MRTPDRHIWLVGFSGSGKSTIGPRLAQRLRLPFVDVDTRIAETMKMPIPDIFRECGERRFRKEEQALIARAATGDAAVVSVGGGAFESAANRKTMQQTGHTIYLSCAQRELYRRLKSKTDRPLLQTGETAAARALRIRQLLDRRMKNYRRADITVSTTARTVAQAVDQIIRKLEALHG